MSASMNQVVLIGRLGADPDLTFSKSDSKTQVCKMRVATNRYNSEESDWHQVIVFAEAAEACNRYLHKGALVGITGRIEYKEYKGKWYTTIIAHNVQFLSTSKEEQNKSHSAKTPEKKRKPQESDDVPF